MRKVDQPRLHIVGSSPRSGTTLAFELIVSCLDVEKFGDHEVDLFHGPRHAAKPYVSKMPTDLVHASRLIKWDRHLHVIYMQRDPRDVIVSEHGSRPGEYWCDFPLWQRNETVAARLRGHPRFLECRYEDLVQDPNREQARILAAFPFLGQRHPFDRFHEVAQSSDSAKLALKGVRQISAASVGTWQGRLPRVAAQLRKHPEMAVAVVAAGYAPSEDWTLVCAEVTPDSSESVRARHDPLRGKGRIATALARIQRRLGSLRREMLYVLGHRVPL